MPNNTFTALLGISSQAAKKELLAAIEFRVAPLELVWMHLWTPLGRAEDVKLGTEVNFTGDVVMYM
jgi:hypothetical protein